MASGQRTKRSIKDRPKHRQERSLRTRRRKAKLKATAKRSRNRAKAKRRARSNKLRPTAFAPRHTPGLARKAPTTSLRLRAALRAALRSG